MDETVLGVDVGGTFTDVVLVAEGTLTTTKVPTTPDQSEGVLAGIERAIEAAGVDAGDVDRFRHATTVAVNAMLESSGAETALVTTEGFGDVLAIGRQDRPGLYDLDARRPDPLVPADRRYELDERATAEGIERTVDADELQALADRIDAESVAVSFLHAYAHPDNEQRAADVLRQELDVPVSASHEVLAEFREYERTATTVDDGSLAVDFAGTAAQVSGNVNAPLAVAESAVYYVVRSLTDPEIPPNQGCYDPITVEAPTGSLLNPEPPAAVVGGNVETSQRVTEIVFDALAAAAPERVPAEG